MWFFVVTGRGCIGNCAMCPYIVHQGRRRRIRSCDSVLQEIEYLYWNLGVRRIAFRDPNIALSKGLLTSILQGIIKKQLPIKLVLECDLERLDEAGDFFSVDRQVDDLEEIRKKLGFERITVLGHSWGGGLAAFYAAAHPDRVKKLIVYNGGPVWPELRAAKKRALEERSGPEIKSSVNASEMSAA